MNTQQKLNAIEEAVNDAIKQIEQIDIYQQPPAQIQINAPVALMQMQLTGQMEILTQLKRQSEKKPVTESFISPNNYMAAIFKVWRYATDINEARDLLSKIDKKTALKYGLQIHSNYTDKWRKFLNENDNYKKP